MNPRAGSKTKEPSRGASSEKKLEREVAELSTLFEIAKAVNSSLKLEESMSRILNILHEKMGMERGTLSLVDAQTNELAIEVAHGLDKKAIERGRYRIGEGITGKVVETGEPIVVPNVGNEPLFLNRTRARDITRQNISFICVPIKTDHKTAGVLSVDRLFREDISFEEDVRLLTIISSIVAQAVKIHQLYQKEKQKLEDENSLFKQELKKKFHPANIIGESKRMADVFGSIELVSRTSATVILRGESGTGKELVAHAIHYRSDRAEKPFIKVSCAALPETLLESELFGYEKGAFTGANASKMGRFEMAHGGTLFLDEIGDMPAELQTRLLRVLAEGEFYRVGGHQPVKVDVRVIAATHQDLEKRVEEGGFREDLFHRLNVIRLQLPSLRERREDIPELANHFLRVTAQEVDIEPKRLSAGAIAAFRAYAWPGNVRQLENICRRVSIMAPSQVIEEADLPRELVDAAPSLAGSDRLGHDWELSLRRWAEHHASVSTLPVLDDALPKFERTMILFALARTQGRRHDAAKLLGWGRNTLTRKIKELGMDV